MINEVKKQIIEVVKYSQEIDEPKIDALLNSWFTAKNIFMNKFFKGKYMRVIEDKVTFELNDNAKAQRYELFIEYVANLLNELGGWQNRLLRYLQHITTNEFYNNCLENDYMMPEGKKIQKGTKIVKSFKYFITDDKLLNDIQSKASEIIQENKIEGYLVFSVHPLDFLSSSENTFNWRSCHSLDGEYRTGNLSYMCDKSTIVCYLMAEKYAKLPHFPESVPWTNKKWRVLLHFNPELDVVFAGRQYPFTSPGALEKIRSVMIDEFLGIAYHSWGNPPQWSHWHNDYITDFTYSEYEDVDATTIEPETYAVINRGIWDIHKIIKDAKNSKHFNDLIRSSCYTQPYYMFKHHWAKHSILDFVIGSEIKCLRCGEKTIDGYDSMMCPDCECKYGNSDSDGYRACGCCGIRFYDTRGYWVDDEYICSSCYDANCFTCEACGENYYNEQKRWDDNNQQFLCIACYEEEHADD